MAKMAITRAKNFYNHGGGILRSVQPGFLPRATVEQIRGWYQGAFRIDRSEAGNFTTQYAKGRVAYNRNGNGGAGSVFVDGHLYNGAIAEFAIPALNATATVGSDLNNATVIQQFSTQSGSSLRSRAPVFGPDSQTYCSGIAYIDGRLVQNWTVYYDATGTNTYNSIVVDDADDLAGSTVRGMFQIDGAARLSGYMSPIPTEWQSQLGGPWLAGAGGEFAIVTRLSEGPSLYAFDPADLFTASSGAISSVPRMSFNAPANALSRHVTPWYTPNPAGTTSNSGYDLWDKFNDTRLNTMWTEASQVGFGFIIPGTCTFAAFGASGGHVSGMNQYGTNNVGANINGPYTEDYLDNHTYIWLFDVNEILEAGNIWDIAPYAAEVFDDRFVQYGTNSVVMSGQITGGAFDPVDRKLFLCQRSASGATYGNGEANGHVVRVYQVPEI